MVGAGVRVGPGGVAVAVEESVTGLERSVPVGVQGMGWKGVTVGDAFGATVTNSKDRFESADAFVPHPASRNAAMKMIFQKDFMGPAWWALRMGTV